MSGRKKQQQQTEVNVLEVSLVSLSLCKLFAAVPIIQAHEDYVNTFFLVFHLESHILVGQHDSCDQAFL